MAQGVMTSVGSSMVGVLVSVGLLAPLPLRAQESLSPAVLQCQRDRADPAPCWSEFLAGPAPAQHKALLVALSFTTSFRPAPSAHAATFLQGLLQAAEQERAAIAPGGASSCVSPGCQTEDAFYNRAVRTAWASITSAGTEARGSTAANADPLGAESR